VTASESNLIINIYIIISNVLLGPPSGTGPLLSRDPFPYQLAYLSRFSPPLFPLSSLYLKVCRQTLQRWTNWETVQLGRAEKSYCISSLMSSPSMLQNVTSLGRSLFSRSPLTPIGTSCIPRQSSSLHLECQKPLQVSQEVDSSQHQQAYAQAIIHNRTFTSRT
jgi:hypothetical protein